MRSQEDIDREAKLITEATERNADAISQINQSLMAPETSVIKSIYIDHQAFHDTRMGLLLSLSSPEEKRYIRSRLSQYDHRLRRNFLYAFPDLDSSKFNEESLQSMYQDPKYTAQIVSHAPTTTLAEAIGSILNSCNARNQMSGYYEPVQLVFNYWPMHECQLIKDFTSVVQSYLTKEAAHVSVIYSDPLELAGAYWAQHQIVFLDDLERVCVEDSGFTAAMMDMQAMLNSFVYAPIEAGEDVLELWRENKIQYERDEVLKDLLDPTALYLGLCCQFSFVAYKLIT